MDKHPTHRIHFRLPPCTFDAINFLLPHLKFGSAPFFLRIQNYNDAKENLQCAQNFLHLLFGLAILVIKMWHIVSLLVYRVPC